MTKAEGYVARTEAFLTKLSEKLEFEIVDVEFVKEGSEYYLRAYCDMDKEGGIGIDDCALISRALSDWLDKEDFINEGYILEVSSPGFGRTLKKDKDLLREKGKRVDVKLFKAKDGQKEFCGYLQDFDRETITLETEKNRWVFPRESIAKISLHVDF